MVLSGRRMTMSPRMQGSAQAGHGGSTYNVAGTARALGVHPESVGRMIRGQRLSAIRLTTGRGGGEYRIPAEAVDQLIAGEVFPDANGRLTPLQHRALGKYLLRLGQRDRARAAYE